MTHPTLTSLLLLTLCVVCGAAARDAAAQTQQGPPPAPMPTPAQQTPPALSRKAVAGARVADGWQRYEFGEAPFFSIALPAKHEVEARLLPLGGDNPSPAYTYAGEAGDGFYLVQIVENLPVEAGRMPEDYREGFFDGLLRSLASGLSQELEKKGVHLKAELGAMKRAKVGGLEGRDQDFTLGPFRGRARAVLSGHRAFLVLLLELGETISGTGIAFLDSLEVRSPR